MSEKLRFVDYKNKSLRVAGDLFKPYRRVKTRELMNAQKELEKVSKKQDKIKARIEKIEELMKLETDLDKYDELAKELEKQEKLVEDEALLQESAKIICPLFEDLTVEEFLENAEPQDNQTVGCHLVAIEAFNLNKPEGYIENIYDRVLTASIESRVEDMINPREDK